MSAEEKNELSCLEKCKAKQNDQDFKQKMGVSAILILELYRVLMGAFLIAFVPQKCGENICSISENLIRNSILAQSTIAANSITALAFFALYFIEVKRENKLITYLEVNKFTAVDNDAVGESLKNLPITKRNTILRYDKLYQNTGYVSTCAFICNTVLSAYVVYNHYFDSKTATVFLTNVLFMGTKVSDVYTTVNTKKNIFFSAYLKQKVQFNDVDPDKYVTLDIEQDYNSSNDSTVEGQPI